MSKDFSYKCDVCGKRRPAWYNSEHWLEPKGWRQLYDHNMGEVVEDSHMCEKCVPKLKKRRESNQGY